MICNPISYYPDKIDEMTFFQDNNLEKIEIVNHYNALVAKGKYTEANIYINQQNDFYGFFSDFLNLIENRIYTLQNYLLHKPLKNQPFLYYDKKGYGIRIFSDLDIEEDLNTIKLFSPDENESMDIKTLYVFENLESLDNLYVYATDTDEQDLDEMEPPFITEDTIWI